MSKKYLKYRDQLGKARPVVDHDLACVGCGYNLRGLKAGSRCPECGLAASIQTMREMPLLPGDPAARSRLQYGFMLASGVFLMFAILRLLVVGWFMGLDREVVFGGYLICYICWCVAVFMITPRSLRSYGPLAANAREFARYSQLLWIPLLLIKMMLESMGPLTGVQQLLWLAWFVGRIIPAAGLIVLLMLLSHAAWDAGRDDVASRMGRAVWGMAAVGLIVALFPGTIIWFAFFVIFLPLLLVWIYFILLTSHCFFSMSRSLANTSRDVRRQATRSDRIREKKLEMDREVASNVRRFDS